jgi:AcrR family transcriptional regulator
MAGDDGEIPRSLRLLWERANRPARGPQPALSLDRIVAVAIEIADAEGLQALSMARLAERLGCATMSLYRHVASKDELQVLMMDTAPGEPPTIEIGPGEWRAGLEQWARALQAVYYRHPWILHITIARPPLEPGQLAWFDRGLRTLGGTNLSPADKLSVAMLILNYVRGEAQIALGLTQTDQDSQAWYARTMAKLVDAERFPALAELTAAGTFDPDDTGTAPHFEFGLARILDGIESLVERTS